MTEPYTPTMSDLIDGWACEHMRGDGRVEDLRAAAERAIAQHDREVAAKALREAADTWTQGEWSNYIPPRGNERPALILGMAQAPGDWLRERADRIERGDA